MSAGLGRTGTDQGTTLIELLLVVVVVAVLCSFTAPVAADVVDASRVRHAASFLTSRFRQARQEAVNAATNVGIVFDLVGTRWSLRVCRDGTGNGLRRLEIQAGTDPCFEGPHELTALFPGVDIAVDPALRGPAGEPGSADPVRFGSANMLSFSPMGSCTAGSLFLRSRAGAQYVVRVGGGNGRVRVFRHEVANGWREQ